MSLADLLDVGFPHSTPDGYTRGCRGNHCEGREKHGLSCAEAMTWFRSDFGFRRLVLAGSGAVDLGAYVAGQRARGVASDREERARIMPKRREPVKAAPNPDVPRPRGNGRPWPKSELAELRRLNKAGMTDAEIARELGRPKASVWCKRDELGLPRNRRRKVIPHGSMAGWAAGCREECCHEPAKAYWREQSARARAAS